MGMRWEGRRLYAVACTHTGLSERCERRLQLFEPRGMVEPE
jgi:hypothetical protein